MIYKDSVFLSNEKTQQQFNSYLNLDSDSKSDLGEQVRDSLAHTNHLLRGVLPNCSLQVHDLGLSDPGTVSNNIQVYQRLL